MLWLVSLAFSKEDEEERHGQSVKIMFTTSCDIFIQYLLVVTFSHVLHLDVLQKTD